MEYFRECGSITRDVGSDGLHILLPMRETWMGTELQARQTRNWAAHTLSQCRVIQMVNQPALVGLASPKRASLGVEDRSVEKKLLLERRSWSSQ
ncbi:hypothetical protein KSF_103470 [Reticulibacter mediterranei]|uniref:Uncharacterized protein n=1 Tax=Reticulibacter mediterranei TaxID=2778369 RepID=A0A8J3N6K6_9CHLR|nr:hypothetical protein KSF_103470 [Reticulibacter mediterranei]